MNFFDYNESLKEELVLNFRAVYAKTTFFKNGVLLLPEPFYETIVVWDKTIDGYTLEKAASVVNKYRYDINEKSEMTDILFEYNLGRPSFLWSIFPDKEIPDGIY